VTGRPVPAAVLHADRAQARERFGLAPGARCLLVVGGSQGSETINRCAIAAFAERAGRDYDVLHVAGHRDHAEIEARLERAPVRDRYLLLSYEPDLGDCLAASDLVLARSGGSIFELTAAGKPAILVPYPHATADHQTTNARWMADAGAAAILTDSQLDPDRLAAMVAGLFADQARLAEMAAASRSLAMPDAAARIADEVLAAAGTGGRGTRNEQRGTSC
jgi:UDP-N-acetylglucosamine--N-acetylmuramyl-(pentapeptide) pyrophosphoryl-undecaprenol N-acetylglucosamine transferase